MIDAYTIGITLALNDGVSAGIASIQRDVNALTSAVGNGASQLERLRELGRQVITPFPAKVDDKSPNTAETLSAAPVKVSGQTEQGSREQERGADSVSIARVAVPPSMSFATLADRTGIRQDGYERSTLADALFRRETEPGAAEAGNAATAALSEIPSFALPEGSRTNTWICDPWAFGRSLSPQFAVDPNVGVQPQKSLSEDQPTVAAAPPLTAMAHSGEIGPVIQQPVAAASSPWSGFALPPAYIQESPAMSESSRVSGPDWLRSENRSAAALAAISPLSISGRTAVPETQNAPGMDTLAATSAGTGFRRSGGSGSLYLDGISIGRWMFDQLADQASRPHVGFSGLDPRLSPAFPGAPSDG